MICMGDSTSVSYGAPARRWKPIASVVRTCPGRHPGEATLEKPEDLVRQGKEHMLYRRAADSVTSAGGYSKLSTFCAVIGNCVSCPFELGRVSQHRKLTSTALERIGHPGTGDIITLLVIRKSFGWVEVQLSATRP